MAETDVHASVDVEQDPAPSISLVQSTASLEPRSRPTPRKLPKFPIDLNMPMMVYWPHDDSKFIRSLREYEYGGPLPEKTTELKESSSLASVAPSDDSKKDIIIPGVCVLPEYGESTANDFALPANSYMQYSTPSWLSSDIHFDRQRVEYGIDDADLAWLSEQGFEGSQLDEEAMELLIDILEKESFRQLEFRQINAQVAQVDPEEGIDEHDLPCAACGARDCDEENPILFCDGCDLPVHMGCQDLQHIPDGDWFCDTCLYRKVPTGSGNTKSRNSTGNASSKARNFTINMSIPVPCILCGMVDGGIFKRTQIPGSFVHIACALMNPEVWFENNYANVSRALQVRKTTECAICKFPGGVVKCHQRTCSMHYHVTCARENGQRLYFHLPDPEEEEEAILKLLDDSHPNNQAVLAGISGKVVNGFGNDESMASESRSRMDDSFSEDVDILGMNSDSEACPVGLLKDHAVAKPNKGAAEKPKKRKKRKTPVPKKKAHQPFQSLCALHSGALRVEKIEEARKASLALPVEVGRFLREEEFEPCLDDDFGASDTTTFTKAVSILRKQHSLRLSLQRDVFDRVVAYWTEKRRKTRLGHMPFIFQLHVLVTHFKENFDAGRKLESRPRKVELTLAQYSNEKKLQMLKQLRDDVEALRTLADLVKKREVKKRLAIVERLALFDAVMSQDDPKLAVRQIFAPSPANPSPHPFSFGIPPLTIRIPVSHLRRSYATSSRPIAMPPPTKKTLPLPSPKDDAVAPSTPLQHSFSPTIPDLIPEKSANTRIPSPSPLPPLVASLTSVDPIKQPQSPHQIPMTTQSISSGEKMDVDPPIIVNERIGSTSSIDTSTTTAGHINMEVKSDTDDVEVIKAPLPTRTPLASPTKSVVQVERSTSMSPTKKAITDYFRPIPPKAPMHLLPARSPAQAIEILE